MWSGPCIECGSSFQVLHNSVDSVAPACCVFPGLSGSGSQRLARVLRGAAHLFPLQRAAQAGRSLSVLSPGAARLFPPRPQRAPQVGSQEVFRQELGPVCRVGGGGFSGAEFAPFPSPLPPASSEDGPALLRSFSVPLFCEPPAVVFGPVNFSLLSHSLKKLPLTALRAFEPVLTLSNAAPSSPFRPRLLVACAGIWGTFLLRVAFRHVICGPYLIFPPSEVALRDLKTSPRPASARVSW